MIFRKRGGSFFCVFCGDKIFFDSIFIFGNERIRRVKNFLCGTKIFVHNNCSCWRKIFVEVQKVFRVRASPRINCLVRIAYDEKIFVIGAKRFHKAILNLVDVLKFIDHNVFESCLPFLAHGIILLKNVQHENN